MHRRARGEPTVGSRVQRYAEHNRELPVCLPERARGVPGEQALLGRYSLALRAGRRPFFALAHHAIFALDLLGAWCWRWRQRGRADRELGGDAAPIAPVDREAEAEVRDEVVIGAKLDYLKHMAVDDGNAAHLLHQHQPGRGLADGRCDC